ncbi:glutathione S-transferase protein [Novosphingobium sp. Rr 2-17]|uniref:glutathione S-transferase family protein n=1 Tax=Novosphingobium sp. Rr 2-17 TaxID=555793 RepID=UPI000269A1D2|nr:glutathione S-transferase [Novosphingobium sp. Rr 2-17]EIZ79722.1 glutathione S-transferase protein [Novosphingobium sp. Rr 2-17]
MKLYGHPVSGHSHRVRLFLSILGLPYEEELVDLATGQHKSPGYLALNAFGEVPVLDDDGVLIADSNAILVYLARKAGPSHWLPADPVAEAQVQRWFSVAAGKVHFGLATARLIKLRGVPLNYEEAAGRAYATLKVMEQTLSDNAWLARTAEPTLADLALYSYVASAGEGDISLDDYPAVRAWLAEIEALDGFVPFAVLG